MRKLTKLFFGFAVLAVAAACSRELDFSLDRPHLPVVTVTASVEESATTKAFLDEDLKIEWNAGDAISLLSGTSNVRFTARESGLRTAFEHSGSVAEQAWYGLYPYDASAVEAGGVITTTLPTVQTAESASFGRDANLAVAYAQWGKNFYFRNAAAYAKVSFRTEDESAQIRSITVRSLDEKVLLSGKVTLTPTLSDGEVSNVELAVTDGVPYARVEAAEGTFLSPGLDYYIVVAPGALSSGYRVEFETGDGLVFSKDYDGAAYQSAAFRRNTIAPVGRKNLDNYEMEGYYRVHYADSRNHPGAGEYLVAFKMPDGSYRILNEDRTDTYIVKGTQFELSGSGMAFNASYKREQMEGMVAYVFRNAWIPSDEVAFADDEVILSTATPVSVKSYEYGSQYSKTTYYYANVALYNRTDATQVTLTLDQLACTLNASTDAGLLSGTFNTRQSSVNPGGNPNSCSDLVDALLKHATFSGFDDMVKNAAVSALKGDDNKFTGGFTTASHTSKNGVVSVNHFMIKTGDLLSGAQLSDIWLYKKGTKTYSEYKNI